MLYAPLAVKRLVAAGFVFRPYAAKPILADKTMSRVRLRTERSEACP